jgi:hypothetical protein
MRAGFASADDDVRKVEDFLELVDPGMEFDHSRATPRVVSTEAARA